MKRDIEIKRVHGRGKARIDGAPNKKKILVAKFLNFKDKQVVLFEYQTESYGPKVYL